MDSPRYLAGSSTRAQGSTRTGGGMTSISDPGHSSQPSLPSIRELHPYLPPSGLSQHHSVTGGSGEGPSYVYSAPAPPQFLPPPSGASILGSRKGLEVFALDSEADDIEEMRGPPKKKRRRQALSCTECKRRKIKCDRATPCAPCTRRGEQSRCQWHIVEPTEKYVTRAEFDELKARHDELYEQVQRLQAATQLAAPYYQMGIPPAAPGAPVEVPSFPASASATGPLGNGMMPPSQTYHPRYQGSGPERFIKPEDPGSGSSRHHQSSTTTSPGVQTQSPSTSSMRPPHNNRSASKVI